MIFARKDNANYSINSRIKYVNRNLRSEVDELAKWGRYKKGIFGFSNSLHDSLKNYIKEALVKG